MSPVPELPLLVRALGTAPAASLARRVTRRRLRVLAYHDVPDAGRFEQHLRHLVHRYRPVSGPEVAAWLGGAELPERAVWVTFDDGYLSVFTTGRELLDRYGVPATAFVCPGVATGDRVHWWDRRPDGTSDPRWEVAGPEHWQRWSAAGHELGNHTWEHPFLDTRPAAEQRHQIIAAGRWIDEQFGCAVRPFAYPGGHVTGTARTALAELGCRLAVGYDHRLARRGDPLAVSRLRIAADDPVWRLEAGLAGAQPAALTVAGRIIRGSNRAFAAAGEPMIS